MLADSASQSAVECDTNTSQMVGCDEQEYLQHELQRALMEGQFGATAKKGVHGEMQRESDL